MANGTTNIFDLPTNPNIKFDITDNIAGQDTKLAPITANVNGAVGGVSLDQTTINQIVSGLQQASITGATQLVSRDIPLNKSHQLDNQVQQDYVPPPPKEYIPDDDDENDLNENINKTTKINFLGNSMDDIQFSVLLAIIYFLFQLPYIKKILLTYIPVLFFKDGNINIYGNLFLSIMFGLIYYIINIFIKINDKNTNLYE